MSLSINEIIAERRYVQEPEGGARYERVFALHGSDDPADADAFGPQLNDTWGTNLVVVRRDIEVADGRGSAGTLRLRVTYRNDLLPGTGEDPEYEWNAATTMQRRRRACAAQQHYPTGGGDAQIGDAIEVHDGRVEGVDVHVPTCAYRETHYRSDFPQTYQQTLLDLTGRVNDAAWRGWAAGEVLFVGAVARRRKGEPWRVTYSFLIAPNETLSVPLLDGGSANFSRDGWDHVWFSHGRALNASDELVSGITAAHVAPVYEPASFTLLDID